jgi:hypothetical protein
MRHDPSCVHAAPLALCFARARTYVLRHALLALSALAAACSSHGAGKPSETPTEALTMEQAQAIVDAEAKSHGVQAQAQAPAPTSLAEVMTILRHDESARFTKTRDYLSGLPGVDALILRATLEMLWADGQLTVAALAQEHAIRSDAEASALKESLRAQPNDAALKARADKATQTVERERRLERALHRLADPHYEAALSLAHEVERQNPERAEGYSVLANLLRLRREWNDFEIYVRRADEREPGRADILYARALEQAERLSDRAGGRAKLEALLTQHADLARARAQLLLLQDDAEARYQQLEALKRLNPQHALVLLEGHQIEAEYRTAMELRAARAPQSATP